MLNIISHPNPILRKKSQPVTDVLSDHIQKLIPEMLDTMIKAEGVGLAAPQIGQNIRLIVIGHQGNELAIINPVITQKSWRQEWGGEGCLSILNKYGEVRRHRAVTISYTDTNNQKQTLKAKGLLARIIQHEIDHLDGVLFIDKVRNLQDIKPDESTN